MGRQKEKLYQSATEQRLNSQARSGTAGRIESSQTERHLPFSHCALSLVPYTEPVLCRTTLTSEKQKIGIIFENSAILPFLLKYKKDPLTGEPMSSKDLITLHMDKDSEGRWQCPVLEKPFGDHSKVVAILQSSRTDANVISFQAYHELNVKAKNFVDLISGESFTKAQVVLLNDPNVSELNKSKDINQFYHIRHERELKKDDLGSSVKHSRTAARVMEQLQEKEKARKDSNKKRAPTTDNHKAGIKRRKILVQDVTGVALTTSQGAASFTSTGLAIAGSEAREATDEEIRAAQFKVMRKLKKKGYVRLKTSMGNLMLELHCDQVPMTCANFLGLCASQAYDGSSFHRLIPGFMVQGGGNHDDEKDESLWGGAIKDEFDDRLKHTERGVVSMANAGPNTGTRQFFVTFDGCNHLDRKHSIFGSVVEGMETLKKIEGVGKDKIDRPLEDILITGTDVLVDPAQEAKEIEDERLQAIIDSRAGVVSKKPKRKQNDDDSKTIGRYLKLKSSTIEDEFDEATSTPSAPTRLTPPPKKTSFKNFGGW